MTKEEFLEYYAKNSGCTVEKLKQHGFDADPCDCGEEGCMGWKAVFWRRIFPKEDKENL